MTDFSIEKSIDGPVIGLDEVGRGPLAGPVVSCGCYFYNYDDFSNLTPNEGPEFIIDSISGDNLDKTPIYDQASSFQINVKDSDGNLFPHTAYYVILREGVGDNPTVADSVYVRYKLSLIHI